LELRRRRWYVLMSVPPSLQQILGRRRFCASTGTDNRQVAERRAAVKVAQWLGQIERARGITAVSSDAAWWRQAMDVAHDDDERDLIRQQLADEARVRVERAATRAGIVDDRDPGYQELPELAASMKLIREVTAVTFTGHLEPWLASLRGHLEAKTIDGRRFEIAEFAKVCPFVADVTRKVVQKWAQGLLEDGYKRSSVTRKASNLRAYWDYLVDQEIVSDDNRPFDKIKLGNGGSGHRTGREPRRVAFEPAEIVRLRQMALDQRSRRFTDGDQVLADFIAMGMYTGARAEEIAALRVEHVDLAATTLTIVASKTCAHAAHPHATAGDHRAPREDLEGRLRVLRAVGQQVRRPFQHASQPVPGPEGAGGLHRAEGVPFDPAYRGDPAGTCRCP
jgi:hypothetical protein